MIDVKTPPSLELLLAYAHVKLGFFDDAFTREWFRQMRDVYMWIHPKTDSPVRHWPVLFCKWIANRAAIDEARDPHRGPGARENARRRLSNHVDITKEERDDLLGKCGF